MDLNFPPIFQHVEVTQDMLCEKFKQFAQSCNMKFPLEKQLSLTFNANEIILTTPTLKYYLDNGLIIKKMFKVYRNKISDFFKLSPKDYEEIFKLNKIIIKKNK